MLVTSQRLIAVRRALPALITGLVLWSPSGTTGAGQPGCSGDALYSHLASGVQASSLDLLAAARQAAAPWASTPIRSAPSAQSTRGGIEDQQSGRLSEAALRDRVARYQIVPSPPSDAPAVALNSMPDPSCPAD
jgi:hypothetical protein